METIKQLEAKISDGYGKFDNEKYFITKGKLKALKEVVKELDKTKIIKDEFCLCGCSKRVHQPHQLDKNGGRCNNCVHCPIYTWASFEFVDLGKIKQKLTGFNEETK